MSAQNKEKRYCVVCGREAVKAIVPMVSEYPDEEQGFMDYRRFGFPLYFCEKHGLELEEVQNI